MLATINVFHAPKAGCSEEEYEDAYWAPIGNAPNPSDIRMAVADGATETSFAALWAKLLVHAYGRGRLASVTFLDQMERMQRLWRRCTQKKALPWYAEEKARMGAFSSLLGVAVLPSANGQGGEWQVLSAGDSCFFQIRGEERIAAFPISTSKEFTSRPLLLSSLPTGNGNLADVVTYRRGEWQPGDELLLMTDAIACWFLKCWELSADPLDGLRHLRDQQDFEQFVQHQRTDRTDDGVYLMKNDDVTLISARLG